MIDIVYVRPEDTEEYYKFARHHLPLFTRPAVTEVWHYTGADGLMSILKTGQIWSTQITCLNDTLEQRYFGSLLHDEIKKMRSTATDLDLHVLLRIADDALANADFAAAGHFVACFSEVEDDLGQWRGYGGGECGYAIGFRYDALVEIANRRPMTLFLPMHYEEATHTHLVQDVVRLAQIYFLQGIQRGLPDKERWARDFVSAFSDALDIYASLIKHPKFAGERERRMATRLMPGEHKLLEFRQKRTLLARHLPLDFTVGPDGAMRLPVTRVYVGPGPSQRVSLVSVGDLLKKYGYDGIPIERSNVPYRIP
jgi:hypothetical protein